MRKLLTFLTTLTAAVAVIVLFTACEQFLKDPEDFLSYWASEAFIKDHSIGAVDRPDGAGVPCVSSSPEVHIMLTVHNPKNFPLVMPTALEPAGIVEFKELSEPPGRNPLCTGANRFRQAEAYIYKRLFTKIRTRFRQFKPDYHP